MTIPFIGSHVDSANTEDAVLGHIFGRASEGTQQYFKQEGGYLKYHKYRIPETLREVHVINETSLPFGAFSGCANLTEIYLNAGITKVESCAFYECSRLEEVYFEGNAPTIVSDAFRECGSLNAYIPAGNTTWTDAVKQNYYASAIRWLEKVIVTVDEIVVAQPAAGGVPTTLPGKDGSYTVAMDNTDGLQRSLKVTALGAPISMPTGEQIKGRMMNVIGESIDGLRDALDPTLKEV